MDLHELMCSARDWVCTECGERGDATSPSWRCAGSYWEHHHGYPLGHVPAVHDPLPDADEKEGE